MTQRPYHIAAALIRHDDHILLVQQRGPTDPVPTWALPGGVVEDGELLTEALIREVREETGLSVSQVGPLVYVAQLDNPCSQTQSLAFIFEIITWSGMIHEYVQDDLILGAAFYEIPNAVAKLQTLPWQVMRQPLIAYLEGMVPRGSVWLYRQSPEGNTQLIATLQASTDRSE